MYAESPTEELRQRVADKRAEVERAHADFETDRLLAAAFYELDRAANLWPHGAWGEFACLQIAARVGITRHRRRPLPVDQLQRLALPLPGRRVVLYVNPTS